MKVEKQTSNITQKDLFNMKSASASMKDFVGAKIQAVGAAMVVDVDENGEDATFNYIMDSDGNYYSGSSVVVRKSMGDLIDMIDASETPIDITFDSRKGGKGSVLALKLL